MVAVDAGVGSVVVVPVVCEVVAAAVKRVLIRCSSRTSCSGVKAGASVDREIVGISEDAMVLVSRNQNIIFSAGTSCCAH